jgi:hypothetical protein
LELPLACLGRLAAHPHARAPLRRD